MNSSRRAFTLIELLVVIAVIGIIAAILLPAIARAKITAQRTTCMDRLKQWSLAQTMYVQDNNDYIPRENAIPGGATLELWANAATASSADVWYNALPQVMNQRSAASFFPLNKTDFYDNNSLFHCPTAFLNNNPGIVQNGPFAYFSIAMNSKLIEGSDRTIRVTTVKQPSATVFFLENRLKGEPMVDPNQVADSDPNNNLGQPSSYANRFVARHNNVGNLAFVDGHTQGYKGNQVVQTQPGDPNKGKAIIPQSEIIWTADPGINP